MKRLLTILALSGVLTTGALAQTQIQGVDAYVTGNPGSEVGGFSPGTGTGPDGTVAELQVRDDGTNGDASAGDDIFSVNVDNMTSGTVLSWKVASAGFGPVNSPTTGDNQYAQVPADPNNNITFFIKTTPFSDGFSPEPGTGTAEDGYVWASTHLDFFQSASEIAVVGNFQDENGGSSDFDPNDAGRAIMTLDSGTIYTADITGIPAGNYAFKIVTDNDFAPADVSSEGLSSGGGDIGFTSQGTTDTITISLDIETARHRVENSVTVPPGFYATSDAWTQTQDATTIMSETAPGSDVWTRTFTVAMPGDYRVRVRDENLNAWPTTNDFPITTTSNNQDVIVIFDQNTYNDGWTPNTNLMLCVDAGSRASLTEFDYLQVVGNFQSDITGVPADNFAENANFELTEDVADSDQYTWVAPFGTTTNTNSPADYKVAGRRAPGDGFFDFQVGGGNPDTVTQNGNNPNATGFTYGVGDTVHAGADTAWGRITMSTSPVVFPSRPSYLGGASVDSWSAFD